MAHNLTRQTMQRSRAGPQRVKVNDENAVIATKNMRTTKLVGAPVATTAFSLGGAQRVPPASKLAGARAALGEITAKANSNKNILSALSQGKANPEPSKLKQPRPLSLQNTGAQRVPVANARGPSRSSRDRSSTLSVPVTRSSMRFPETLLPSEVEEEEQLDLELEADDDIALVDPPATSEAGEVEDLLDERLILEDDEVAYEEVEDIIPTKQQQPREIVQEPEEVAMDLGPWPQIPRAQADACAKRVAEIQSTFHDEVDMWDTTMVSEYADEILQYMGELEVQTMPNPDYLDTQAELTVNMRFKLVDWIAQVHMRYHLLPETLWIAVNIMDRFLSKRAVSLEKVQLVGMTALFIAAKYEEIIAPSVEEFVWISDKAFSREEILKGERIVLQTLDFRVSSYCSPYTWVRRISKADDYDLQTRTLSKFLIECTLLDHRFLRAKPSLIAALGMYSARQILGGDWDAPFIFYSGFTAEELDPGHIFLLEKLVDENFAQCSICLKYASKKFLKASLFAIDWAKNNYTTLTQPGVEQKMLMT